MTVKVKNEATIKPGNRKLSKWRLAVGETPFIVHE